MDALIAFPPTTLNNASFKVVRGTCLPQGPRAICGASLDTTTAHPHPWAGVVDVPTGASTRRCTTFPAGQRASLLTKRLCSLLASNKNPEPAPLIQIDSQQGCLCPRTSQPRWNLPRHATLVEAIGFGELPRWQNRKGPAKSLLIARIYTVTILLHRHSPYFSKIRPERHNRMLIPLLPPPLYTPFHGPSSGTMV